MRLYPNPTADRLSVRLAAAPVAPGRLTLLDGTGRIVRTQALAPTAAQPALELRGLPTGLYLLRVQQGRQTQTRKVRLTN